MPVLLQAIQALQNGTLTPDNAITQELEKMLGSPVPTNMEAIPQYVSNETMRFLRGSGAFPEQEQAALQQVWSKANSTAQLMGAYQKTQQMLAAGAAGLKANYDAVTRGAGGRLPGIPAWEQVLNDNEAAPAAAPGAPIYAQNHQTHELMQWVNNQWIPVKAVAK